MAFPDSASSAGRRRACPYAGSWPFRRRSFVDFDDAHEFPEFFVGEPGPDAMAHIPSRPVGAEAEGALDLERADALLTGEHQVDDAEPIAERLIRVLEDRPGDVGETIIVSDGEHSLQSQFHRISVLFDHEIAAPGASNAFGPTGATR